MAVASSRNSLPAFPGVDRVKVSSSPVLRRVCCNVKVGIVISLRSKDFDAICRNGWRRRREERNFAGLEFNFSGSCSFSSTGIKSANGPDGPAAVMEWDVVEYPISTNFRSGESEGMLGGDFRRRGVGVVVSLTEESQNVVCHIEPLRQKDPNSKEWTEDEEQDEITVAVGQVRVLQAWYSQRMVADRISNPHGEHAENLWVIDLEMDRSPRR